MERLELLERTTLAIQESLSKLNVTLIDIFAASRIKYFKTVSKHSQVLCVGLEMNGNER
jgi:hypothetical protein